MTPPRRSAIASTWPTRAPRSAHGRGRGIVVATGMATEFGKIAACCEQAEEPKTPLQKRLAAFGQRLAMAVLAICAIDLRASASLRGEPLAADAPYRHQPRRGGYSRGAAGRRDDPAGAGRAQDGARTTRLSGGLPAVETLGSVTYICSDKTGTLTQNRMRVEEIFVAAM